jgi:DNA-binding transcriptional MerR regulator
MQSYPINELERLTGVKAHTIRIWEKRYGLIVPERTKTNRRYYNDDQVRKLLNVSTLLAHGQKISKVAVLTEAEINDQIQNAPGAADHGIATDFINDLIKSMIGFDEHGFEKIFSAAVIRYGFFDAMLQVIYPFLSKVGVLWSVDVAAPGQEHFATSIIRRKLMAAIDGILPGERTKKFLLFLPEGEWHEIGLLLACYMIRSQGYDALYLGQNVPYEDVLQISGVLKPDYLLTFYVTPRPIEELTGQLKLLQERNTHARVLVAGKKELFGTGKARVKNITYLDDVKGLLGFLS